MSLPCLILGASSASTISRPVQSGGILFRDSDSDALSVQLVRSLFCGLPRKDKRVAVVISASDETYRGSFCYGGLIAPVKYWDGIFAERWERRVLSGPPRIPYLHMTDIRSAEWRRDHNISAEDAEQRVEQAVNIICKRNDPALFAVKFNGDLFNKRLKRKVTKPSGKAIWMMPDHLGFLGYALIVLDGVRKVIPTAEKVDFLVERNVGITDNLKHFYNGFPEFLELEGKQELLPLLGEIIPAGKERSPLQAADLFCWHYRRGSESTLSGDDLSRWNRLERTKKYCFGTLSDEAVSHIAEASEKDQGIRQSRPSPK